MKMTTYKVNESLLDTRSNSLLLEKSFIEKGLTSVELVVRCVSIIFMFSHGNVMNLFTISAAADNSITEPKFLSSL